MINQLNILTLHLHPQLLHHSALSLPLSVYAAFPICQPTVDAQCTFMTLPVLLETMPALQQQHNEIYFSLKCTVCRLPDVFMFNLLLDSLTRLHNM